MGGRPPAPARLGARAAAAGRRVADRDDHARARACPERVLAAVRRRAAADRPAPRRPAAARARRSTEQLGTTALVAWLRRRIAEADQDTGDEDRSRRLESDAEAVQVLTVHRSKGLEFPDRLLPRTSGSRATSRRACRSPSTTRTPATARTIDVGLEGPDFDAHKRAARCVEQRGEDLRLAYVALTRARHQAVVWWAGVVQQPRLARSAGCCSRAQRDGRSPRRAQRADRRRGDARASRRSRPRRPGASGRAVATLGLPRRWSGPLRAPAELAAARFDRELDPRWRRTSFSDITAGAHEARGGERARGAGACRRAGDAVRAVGAARADEALRAIPSLLGAMPAGARIGTFVHRVLEATDFAAADLEAELAARVAEVQAYRPVDDRRPGVGRGRAARGDRDAARPRSAASPARPRARRPPRRARLRAPAGRRRHADERGSRSTRSPRVLREHLPPGDPLAGYADRLADPALRRSVRGYVTGSIDLVARVGRSLRRRRLQDELARRRRARS